MFDKQPLLEIKIRENSRCPQLRSLNKSLQSDVRAAGRKGERGKGVGVGKREGEEWGKRRRNVAKGRGRQREEQKGGGRGGAKGREQGKGGQKGWRETGREERRQKRRGQKGEGERGREKG